MKKKIIATAVVVLAANAASAASSVTLYGVVDVGYGHESSKTEYTYMTSKNKGNIKQNDGYHDGSRLGVKGQEDLGNGLSAIFATEMRFAADTGALSTQFDHSYVGLKGGFGEVTVGRRANINDDIFGYSSNAKEVDFKLAEKPWDNNLSYRGQFGGLKVGADVTTGENIMGAKGGREQQYAAGVEYNFGKGAVALGYEHAAAKNLFKIF